MFPKEKQQQSVPPAQQSPVAASARNSELINKKINNAGQAVLRLGGFFLLLSVIIIPFVIGDTSDHDSQRSLLVIVAVVPTSIYWIFAGRGIRRNRDNPQKALSIMKIVLITAIAVTIWRIGISVALNDYYLGITDFTIVLAIYILVAMYRLKKLAK